MRFATSFQLIALVGAFVSASPVEKDCKYAVGWNGSVLDSAAIGTPLENVERSSLQARTPGGVYICTDINWGGQCGYAVQQLGACIALTAPWYNTISSFGPDAGATCFAYSQNSCSEAQWTFRSPGDATGGLGTSSPWNDRITNFKCV
ncbi:unnamed protein product [Mycena citricolor]|uniref:Uncharacterized protein n=1 Tax=Mycena citricolor TaxID=2018698 RepID=A0AAD2K6T8_9AGAR|nr:unnamed protein product [Mycena citricolor]CAK5282282.1 unnamed protein product [Mycena citricolor]CAK5282296.1 unnamed protein product [Mycena citricolor]